MPSPYNDPKQIEEEYGELFNRLLIVIMFTVFVANLFITVNWLSTEWRDGVLLGYLINLVIVLLWFSRNSLSLPLRVSGFQFIMSVTFVYSTLSVGFLTPYHILPAFCTATAFVYLSARAAFLQLIIFMIVYAVIVTSVNKGFITFFLSYEEQLEDALFQLYYAATSLLLVCCFFYFIYKHTKIISEVSMANRQLVEQNKILVEGFFELPSAVGIWNKEGELLFANDEFDGEVVTKYSTKTNSIIFEDLLKTELSNGRYNIVEEDKERWYKQRVSDFYCGSASFEFELADGRWVNGRNTITSNGYIVTSRADVTQIKQAEKKLRFIMDNVTERILTIAKDGTITFANAGVKNSFGWTSEELVGGKVHQLFGKKTKKDVDRILSTMTAKVHKSAYLQNVEVKRSDGQKFFVDMRVSSRQLNDDVELLMVVYDSWALTKAELSVKQLTEAFKRIDAGVALISTRGEITFYNRSFSDFMDGSADLEMGQSFVSLANQFAESEGFLKHNRADTKDRLERAYENSGVGIEMADKLGRWLQVSFFVLSDGSRLCMVIDVSEAKVLNEQLLQSAKLASLGEMATGIAHEINQPLSVIKLASQNLQYTLSTDPAYSDSVKKRLERILGQVDRATAIIDQMRMYGREAKEPSVEANPLKCVDEALDMLAGELKLADISIVNELPEALPEVNIHPIKLVQVLVVLLSNAKDAFIDNNIDRKSRQIFIGTRSHDSRSLELFVRDTAGGIPTEIIDKVMNPFFTTKDPGSGTGLGLSIASRIIADADGSFFCRNQSNGVVFTIILSPRKDDHRDAILLT